jgi:hypothetical protein
VDRPVRGDARVPLDGGGEVERLRITDVEAHEITVPYEDWIATCGPLARVHLR